MKILNFNGEQYMADKIIKTDNNIIGQNENEDLAFAFKGITDFSRFSLTNEDGTPANFDIADPTVDDLQKQLAALNDNQTQFMVYVLSNIPNLPQ